MPKVGEKWIGVVKVCCGISSRLEVLQRFLRREGAKGWVSMSRKGQGETGRSEMNWSICRLGWGESCYGVKLLLGNDIWLARK